MLRYYAINLLWPPIGQQVRFVLVNHTCRGRMILRGTHLERSALEMIPFYACRFKIEVAFKQSLYRLGT